MATVSVSVPVSRSVPAARTRLHDRVSAGGAAFLSILGLIGVIGIAALALLVVPLAAALAFGPALLERL